MPAAIVHTINVLRVAKCRPADGVCQRGLLARYRYKMDVIGHKTICKNLEAIFVGLLLEQPKKDTAVVIDKENILTIIPSLRDMMGAILAPL